MFLNDEDRKAVMAFAVSQRTHIETEVNEAVYADIQYPSLIPVDTSANEFAKTITYYSTDKYGKADWINGNADDVPMVGTEMSKKETSVHMAGVGYGWGWDELQIARQVGHSLQNNDAMAARRAYEEMVDRVAMVGDTEKGFIGLINNPDVATAPAATGDWDGAATNQQILADVNTALLGVAQETKYTSLANTLLLSPEKLNKLATTPLNDTAAITLLEFLRTNNTYTSMTQQPLMIRAVRGLETAGATNDQRMVAYRRDPQVLKLHIPMPHRFLNVWHAGPLRYEVPGVFRLGGVDIRRTAEVRYVDGI